MIMIDVGDFFLVEPSEIYAEQIREYRQDFLDTNCSMDGCGPLRKCEDPFTYISECEKYDITSMTIYPNSVDILVIR